MEKKTERLTIRMRPKEKDILKRQAKYHNMTISELLSKYIMDEDLRIRDDLMQKFGSVSSRNGHYY